jgi:hypothetical protein
VLISDDDPASEAGGEDDDLEADAGDDDDDVAELTVPDDPLRFTMTWKAMAGKIEMPSSRFSISKASKLSYDDLLEWGSNSEIRYLTMHSDYELTFNVLEAVVTHQKARAQDEFKMEICNADDLNPVIKMLRAFYDNGKKPIV